MSRHSRLAALFAAAGLVLAARAPEARAQAMERVFTLEEAQRLARLNNATVLGTEQDMVIAQQRVQESRLQFLPDIGVQGSASRYTARYPLALAPEFRSVLLFPSSRETIYSARAYFIHTLYGGGRATNTLRLAQSSLKQTQSRYDAAKMDSDVGTARVFYQLLLAQERFEATSERLEAAVPHSTKPLSGWERIEAEGILAALRSRQAESRHAADMARLEFRKALNLELDTPVRVEGRLETRPVEIELSRAVIWALELRPELQVETYKAQMDDIAVSLAQARRTPTIVLGGDYELTDQTFPLKHNNWDATVGVRIPIPFDFYAQVRQKRAEQRQGQIKRSESQDRVRLEVRQAYEQVLFWQEEWPRREKEHGRLKALSESAGADSRPLEALRAQLALLDSQDRYKVSVQEHLLARSRLERAVGRPLH